MGRYTKQDIIDLVRENDVQFIRLQFSDLFGAMKNVAITARQLEKALDNKCTFDGSSVDGFVRIEESDMYLYPDLDSFIIFPWSSGGRVARLICDVYGQDGMPFEGDPRNILKKVMRECKKMGYKFNVGPECEFFLFHTDEEGQPTTLSHEKAGYFDVAPLDLGESARRDMILNLEEMGFEIEASHHEVAPGQHEVDFKYEDALHACDNIQTFKLVVKTVARKHGLHATFMPKPLAQVNGSGMHINMSLFDKNGNVFYDENGDQKLSQKAYYFLGGLLKHARSFTAVTNPTVNSYKRLVPGFEAPVYVAWSGRNRSPLVRVPMAREQGTRFELRSVDPSANPYMAIAAILEAGLDGLRNKIEPAASVDRNIYAMDEEERRENGIKDLPSTLHNALKELKNDEVIQGALGEHLFNNFVEAKTLEWDSYRQDVSQWERDQYLELY